MIASTLLFLAALPGAAAQEALFDDGLDELLSGEWVDEDVGESRTSTRLKNVRGFLEARSRVYTAGDAAGNDSQHLIEAELEFELDLRENLTAYFRPRFLVDLRDPDADRFEPFEAYVTHEAGDWDLRAGLMVENWGIVDTFNPIDVINRRDFASDFLDADRLGELGVRWRRFFEGGDTIGEPTLSLYALPAFRRTLFPTENSRFSLGSPGLAFDEDGGDTPHGSDRAFWAARVQSTLTTEAINADLQFLVARGPDRFPLLMPDGGEFSPFYFGTTTIGGGLRAVPNAEVMGDFLSSLTLKTEIAFKEPYSFDGSPIDTPDDYMQYVLGVDRLFPNLITDGDQLTATVEYAGESGASDMASLLRPFQSDFVLLGLWEAGDFSRRSLEARAILDTELDENIYEVIFEQQLRALHEDLKLTVQLQVFDADDDEGLFSQLPDNTSLAIGLRFEL